MVTGVLVKANGMLRKAGGVPMHAPSRRGRDGGAGGRVPAAATVRATIVVAIVSVGVAVASIDAARAQQPVVSTDRGGPMTGVAFSPEGGVVASSSHDHDVYLWDAESGALIRTLRGHEDKVFALDFSPDGSRLASAGFGGEVRVWNVESGTVLRTWTAEPWPLTVAFSPDGRRVLAGEADGGVRLLSLDDGAASPVEPIQRGVATLDVSPDGDRMAGAFGVIGVRDARTGAVLDTLAGHAGLIFSVAFTPDGRRLVSGSMDATIRVWDVGSGEAVRIIATDWPQPFLAVSPDGDRLATGSPDHRVYLWPLSADGSEPTVIGEHDKTVTGVAFSPDGSRLASSSLDGTVKIWDVPR